MGIEIVFVSNLRDVMGKIDETARQRMFQAVNAVRNDTLERLSGSRSGKTYRVPGTKTTYTASAPGEAPASATGELRQSVSAEVEADGSQIGRVWREKGDKEDRKIVPPSGKQRDLIGMVGTDKKQGLMTEFGTKNMAARPWLRPSFERKEGEIKEIFIRQWF